MGKRIFTGLFWAFLTLGAVHAEASRPMWKITGMGLQRPSYLFGCGALQSAALYRESPNLQDAFGEVEMLIVESNSSPGEFVTKIRSYGLMKEQKLRQILSEETYKKVDKEVQEAITIGLFFLPGSIKPAAISMIICSAWQKKQMENKHDEFLNKYLIGQCKKRKMEVISLESAEEQMDLMMNRYPPQFQADLLKQVLGQKEEMMQVYKQSQEYYNEGEYEKVARLGLDHPLPYAPDEKGLESMISERNLRWIDKIASQMREKSCLILLNPAQLVFEGGMIELLKKAGYTVEKE